MANIKVIGLGAGGHARAVLDILSFHPQYEIVGLLDPDPNLHHTTCMDIPVLGGDDLLPALFAQGVTHAFNGLGSIGRTAPRTHVFQRVKALGFSFIDAIHPQAVVSKYATLGEGLTAMAGAVIGAMAQVGDNVVVNTHAVIEHDCVIAHHVFVATGACLAGHVTVAEGAHIGLSASVRQSISIGELAIVGAGAVVLKDVDSRVTVVGVPAHPLSPKNL